MVVELNPDPLGLFGIGTLAVVAYTYEAVATNGATSVVGVFYGCTTSKHLELFALLLGVGVSVLPVVKSVTDRFHPNTLLQAFDDTSCTLWTLMLQ